MSTKNSKGVSFNDRELASKVRTLALEQVYKILKEGDKNYLYEPLLTRLAPNLLPRLNVLAGDEDGGPLHVEISEVIAKKNASQSSTK